jgi:predicted ATPase
VDIGNLHQGWTLAAAGHTAEGIARLQRGIDGCMRSRMFMMLTLYWAMLARIQLEAGRLDDARCSLREAFALAERNDERFWLAELHRLRGDIDLAQGAAASAADGYRHALAVARQQGARSLELRAAISLARLPQDRVDRARAMGDLRSMFASFSEGFDTADLREARNFLDGEGADPSG